MSYEKLMEFEDIFETRQRLIAYSKYYLNLNINGLHYVNFDSDSGTISISHPNHRTNHLATCFLIQEKNLKKSINTIRGYAYNLKIFLDFLMIWDIDLTKCDLLNLMTAFTNYLMCVEESPCPSRFSNTAHFYSTLKRIPLNDSAIGCGKVVTIGFNRSGFKDANKWHCRSYDSTKVIVSTAIRYLTYLQEKTKKYKDLNINEIPRKTVKSKNSLEAGTLGEGTVTRMDLDYILIKAGHQVNKAERFLNRSVSEVMRLKDINLLISAIPNNNYQNRLLFTILKCFGLREGEASNLIVDTSKLSKNLMYLDKDEAILNLKKNLKGSIEYDEELEKWTCTVTKTDSLKHDKQNKSGERIIPLVFPSSEFEDALLYGIIERKIIMSGAKKNHNYLLVCKGNNHEYRGQCLSGNSIRKRFSDLAKKLKKDTGIDLTRFSPHEIRHFYATHLITEGKHSIYDISKFLGHSEVKVTIERYYHFIKVKTLENSGEEEALNIYNKFKEMRDIASGITMD